MTVDLTMAKIKQKNTQLLNPLEEHDDNGPRISGTIGEISMAVGPSQRTLTTTNKTVS
jgi:hypothetical protein